MAETNKDVALEKEARSQTTSKESLEKY